MIWTNHLFANLFGIPDVRPFEKGSVRLITRPTENTKIKIGQSRIGGLPDLPPEVSWPLRGERPLQFLAQINLVEIHQVYPSSPFGAHGHLAFFYDDIEQPWGGDLQDRSGWAVIHAASDSELVRRDAPPIHIDEPTGQYRWCSVEFKFEPTWPAFGHLEFNSIGKRLARRLEHLKSQSGIEDSEVKNRMLGYADLIQNEMRVHCQLRLNGIKDEDLKYLNEDDLAPIAADAPNLELLLQLDSDDHPGMMWGDVGRLYFWINKRDIEQARYDMIWLEMQCC